MNAEDELDYIYNKYIDNVLEKMSNKDECFQVFNYYSGRTGYKYINRFLLMDEDEELFVKKYKQDIGLDSVKRYIKQIDKCFDKAPVTKDNGLLIWRGMDKDLGLKIGDSVVLKSYTSCSYLIFAARQFTKEVYSKQHITTGTCCIYCIHVGEGISYLPLEKYSQSGSHEGEVLLPRNLVMTYIGDETIGKTGKYKDVFPYQTTLRHMKITKLNDTIPNNKMIDMSEPIIKEGEVKEKNKKKIKITKKKRELSQVNKCPEGCVAINNVIKEQSVEPENKRKRCPKGTRKNKDGLCEKNTKS